MAASLLLGVGALLFSCNAQENNYDRLPEAFKKGVDLSLEMVNSHARVLHHFLFFKSCWQSDIEPDFDVKYIYHHFYLKATNCTKGPVDSTACQFRNDRLQFDCAVCYKTYQDQIEQEPNPYVHCVHKAALTQKMRRARVEHCNRMGYSSGSPTLLADSLPCIQ